MYYLKGRLRTPLFSLMVAVIPRELETKADSLSQALQTEYAAPQLVPAAEPPWPPVWQVAALGTLLLWLYWSTLAHLVSQWWHDPNFSHGFFVPLFAGFVIWQERSKLKTTQRRPSWSGLLFLGFGLCVLILGQMGAEIFLSRFSLLIVLAGLIVLFLGWSFFRAILFPWAFLVLMIPIPAIIFNQITFPLQIFASKIASQVLPWLGVPVLREGNVIILPKIILEVAEACSGIRSLMSLTTLALIYGYLVEKKTSLRVVLALAALPIAVIANSLRVVGTGLLVQYWDPEKAQGFFHEFQGWLMFVASIGMLYLLHWTLKVFSPSKGFAS
jgi:exosortase